MTQALSVDQKRAVLKKRLPELLHIRDIAKRYAPAVNLYEEARVKVKGLDLPIYSLFIGQFQKHRPTLLVTAGIHGLERIGTQVVLAFAESLLTRTGWDPLIQHLVMEMNIVLVPLVNPGGMFYNTRANPNGVDLMRNATIEAEFKAPLFYGGQRLSKRLPWYCGKAGNPMEAECQTLANIVQRLAGQSPLTISIDCHSGFGFRDRLWFPYAYRKRPIAMIDRLLALKLLLDKTFPHHDYLFEPQSLSYITHGDLWDYLYKRHKNTEKSLFIPLTLEMGSWNWVKKRPTQLFMSGGLFNPLAPHRRARVLRRHLMLFEFLCSAALAHKTWLPTGEERQRLFQAAESLWYKR